ncbi:MAG: LysR family transcriptional regulator [Clostridiaceae bacterium]|jgi:DNA-binding transcriptional LysR family regulator|nr:LysR family transcriptional regulator [Clostridiaceae bacterium]
MNMKQLRYVLVLAHEGSFSKAADSLGITQPSLSQYIKKIEKKQGVQLFDRTGGDVRVTDAGHVYIEAARKILDLEQQMERKFEDLSTYKSGSIVVGVSPHRCIHLMPEIVKRFQKFYPGMRLVIEERGGASLLDDAAHGQFDLCIANLPIDEKIFNFQLIMEEEVLLAVNMETPIYQKLKKTAVKVDGRKYPAADYKEIAGERFATLADSQPTQKSLDEICAIAGFRVVNAVECRTIETQFAMVRAGIGAALVPSGISKFSNAEKVAFFSFAQSVPYRDMAVVYRKEQYLSKAVKDLMQIIVSLDK